MTLKLSNHRDPHTSQDPVERLKCITKLREVSDMINGNDRRHS